VSVPVKIEPEEVPEVVDRRIVTIATAIARREGFFAQGDTLAKRNRNPGNLRCASAYLKAPYLAKVDGRNFCVFPSFELGWQALYFQVRLDMVERGKTLAQFIEKYAPPIENDTDAYVEFVAEYTGMDRDEKL